MALRDRIRRLERLSRETRDMEGLKDLFMTAVRDLRARANGEDPPPGGEQRVRHVVVDVERGTRGVVSEVEDLSEPEGGRSWRGA